MSKLKGTAEWKKIKLNENAAWTSLIHVLQLQVLLSNLYNDPYNVAIKFGQGKWKSGQGKYIFKVLALLIQWQKKLMLGPALDNVTRKISKL